jgi:hypothetical protein
MAANHTIVIAVVGATGEQSSAVVDALLLAPNSSELATFAVTRNIESASAKGLVEKSPRIKLVQGD